MTLLTSYLSLGLTKGEHQSTNYYGRDLCRRKLGTWAFSHGVQRRRTTTEYYGGTGPTGGFAMWIPMPQRPAITGLDVLSPSTLKLCLSFGGHEDKEMAYRQQIDAPRFVVYAAVYLYFKAAAFPSRNFGFLGSRANRVPYNSTWHTQDQRMSR